MVIHILNLMGLCRNSVLSDEMDFKFEIQARILCHFYCGTLVIIWMYNCLTTVK